MLQQIVNALVLGSIYVLFALGLSLTWGTLNVLNLAHGSTFMFSGFVAYYISSHSHLPLILLILIAVAVGGVLAVLLDVLIFAQIKKRVLDEGRAELAMMIASIGVATIPVAIAQKQTSDSPFYVRGAGWANHVHRVGGVHFTNMSLVIVVVTIAGSVALGQWVARTRNGRALRALAADADTCGLMGINQRRLATLTLCVSGATAGLAGVLLTVYLGSLTPESGQSLLLKAFAAVILGGVGSIWGTMAGAYLLAFAEISIIATTSGAWTDAISFGVIVVVLLLRPQGIFSRVKVDRV